MTGEWGAGRAFKETARAVKPDDLATIIYTSGTTGEPKGVMLHHSQLVSNLKAAAASLRASSQNDVALSFLPLSHAFERMVAYVYLLCGVTLIFAESFDTLGRDIALVQADAPDRCPARLREAGRAHQGERARRARFSRDALLVGDCMPGWPGHMRACAARPPGPIDRLQAALADRLVFDKVRAALGGRIRYLVSGQRPARTERRRVLPRRRPANHRRLRPHRDGAHPHGEPARRAARRHGRACPARRRAQDRGGRRDPRTRPEHHGGLLQQAAGDGRGVAGRLVPHRRRRDDRRPGLSGDHRSQEGSAGHLGRQENRAAADRNDAQAQPAHRRSGRARRSAKVSRRR